MDKTVQIQAEPLDFQTCRFTVSRPVYQGRSIYFSSREKAGGSPLAERLFGIKGVAAVLIADNQITIGRDSQDPDWVPLGREIGAALREHLLSGLPAVSEKIPEYLPSEKDLWKRVQSILEERINPAVASHGGHVELLDVKKNSVYIELRGGCQGCGMAHMTLKQGIERASRDAIPEVGEILDTTDHAAGRNPYYAPTR
ncbi:MAG: NifU family protein [Armatimonadetes bacterium]|nr:NifU family protein [Armatimonadota bacterium]